MTAPARALVVFRQAGLIAVLLALVAGILGMHVMTANHSAHGTGSAAHAGVAAVEGPAAPGKHSARRAGHAAVGHPPHGPSGDKLLEADSHTGAPPLLTESCGGSCPGADEQGSSCTPSAKAGSLTVVPPRTGLAIHPAHAAGTGTGTATSRVASTPTPCELSISRT
ncbi:hypothetical protein JHV56_04830 [Arthrobacter sp. BHU FT2]|nr:hypothetical protein [Arthrobacter sp. BHU FT2]